MKSNNIEAESNQNLTKNNNEVSISNNLDYSNEEVEQLFNRRTYISKLKQMETTIFEQQHEIEEGREEISYLLGQMQIVLHDKANFYQTLSYIRYAMKLRRNKKFAASLTRKEIKTNFQKCDEILNSTIQQNNSIRNTIETNTQICAALKEEIEKLTIQCHELSHKLYSSFDNPSKDKIIELNNRIDNFHITSNEEYEKKIDSMDLYISELKQKLQLKKAKKNKSLQNNVKPVSTDTNRITMSESSSLSNIHPDPSPAKSSKKKNSPQRKKLKRRANSPVPRNKTQTAKSTPNIKAKSKNTTPVKKGKKINRRKPIQTVRKLDDSSESNFSNALGEFREPSQFEFANDYDFNPFLPDLKSQNNDNLLIMDSNDSLFLNQ